jgi:regulatory protein
MVNRVARTKELSLVQARRVAYALLARKAWSRAELTARLHRRGAPQGVARQVVAELELQGYLDDTAFARQWAQARAARERLGSRRISEELRLKGIPRQLVEVAVRDAFSETPEEAQAVEAARRRLPALARRNPARAPAKLLEYLLRRGYPAGVARSVVRRLCEVEAPEEPEE